MLWAMSAPPLLYTFRRCPYAMRARWAIQAAGVAVKQIEVNLRAKPSALLTASPKGTVPVLVLPGGEVIDQSLDIMLWALHQNDPQGWLNPGRGSLDEMLTLIAACERDFKPHLDRYKYPSRYAHERVAGDTAPTELAFAEHHFMLAVRYLDWLAARLDATGAGHLTGPAPALGDFAIVPFVRQFVRHDRERAERALGAGLITWMDGLLARDDFQRVMRLGEEFAG